MRPLDDLLNSISPECALPPDRADDLSKEQNQELRFMFRNLHYIKELLNMAAKRTEIILRHRSDEEIEAAKEYLWLIRSDIIDEQRKLQDHLSPESVDPTLGYHSDAAKLFPRIGKYNLTSQAVFPGATWKEYFAVEALGRITDAAAALSELRRKDMPCHRRINIVACFGEFAALAVEAIAYADCLGWESAKSLNAITPEVEQKVASQRAKRVADLRYEEANRVKAECVEYYDEKRSQFKTGSATIKAFLDSLEEIRINTLTKGKASHNPHRTLTDHVREHNKNMGKNSDI